MTLTRAAIEKDRLTAVALAVLLIAGLMAYQKLPRNEDPGFVIRVAAVTTYLEGASPERIEELVTDKLERVIQEIPELETVRSESKAGVSVIWADIHERYKDVRPIWDNLRRKIQKAEGELPPGVEGPFIDDEFGDVYGTLLAVTGDGFSYRQLKEVADELRDELLRLDDVGKVDIYGSQEEAVFLEYNNARLSELGVSPLQLQGILEAHNIVTPGGDITMQYEKIFLEPSGNFESLEDIGRTVISLPGGQDVIYLKDVVDISLGYVDPPASKLRVSGEPALGLAISMRDNGNVLRHGQQVRAVLERAERAYPLGVDLKVIQFQPAVVAKKINSFMVTLLQSFVIVAMVMVVTLGLRTGLLVATLIPMTMVMTALVMYLMHIGLDQMSLASLIIAIGLLVDNAIVMSESTMVKMGAGIDAISASVDSSNELRIPLLTSSLTTAAAFLPIYLAESRVGEYCAPLFQVVTITLLCSLALALTMIPLLCARFLKVSARPERELFASRIYVPYRAALLCLVRHPRLILSAVAVLFGLSVLGFSHIPVIFLPSDDNRPTFTAELQLPAGTPIERTEAVVKEIDQFIVEELATSSERSSGITNWAAFIGRGAPRFILAFGQHQTDPAYAHLILNATSREIVEVLVAKLQAFCDERFPDLKAIARPLDVGTPAWPPIEVRISGKDTDELFDIADRVKAKVRGIPSAAAIDDDWGPRSKKLLIRVDQARAIRAGVTSQDVAISLQTYLAGLDATTYRKDDKLIPVTLRSVDARRQDIGKLDSINVYAPASGRSVPLRQVADIEVAWEPSRILRRDRLRTVTVQAVPRTGVTATEVNDVLKPWLDEQERTWPFGYHWQFGGEAEKLGQSRASVIEHLPAAGLIIVLLLVGQFNSIRRPVIILLTIPLAFIGVVIGLLLTNSSYGIMTMFGIIALAGIVINNAIVLLDRVQIELDVNGLSVPRAVIEAAQHRLRPILLTTVTTVGGLLPLWIGGGALWESMVIAIIFGLIFATVLTLGVVPVLYTLLFRVSFKGFQY